MIKQYIPAWSKSLYCPKLATNSSESGGKVCPHALMGILICQLTEGITKSYDHKGLIRTKTLYFCGVTWQRCESKQRLEQAYRLSQTENPLAAGLGATLMGKDEKRTTGKKYFDMEEQFTCRESEISAQTHKLTKIFQKCIQPMVILHTNMDLMSCLFDFANDDYSRYTRFW